jgi:hypothetical protein
VKTGRFKHFNRSGPVLPDRFCRTGFAGPVLPDRFCRTGFAGPVPTLDHRVFTYDVHLPFENEVK